MIDDVQPSISVDKPPLPDHVNEGAPGKSVTYTIKIANASPAATDPVTIDSIVDDVYGNANTGQLGATCQGLLGTTIVQGASASCSFSKTVSGDVGQDVTDKATVHAHDNEANDTSDFDTATVTIDNVNPTISVTKTAGTAADSINFHINEPGGPVTFTVKVKHPRSRPTRSPSAA